MDADCYDGEAKCTVETCSAGSCLKKFTGAAGCCNPYFLDKPFEDGRLAPFIASSLLTTSKWQAWNKGPAHSPVWLAY
ncbi:MAG: hypothetical protein EXR77_08885 [Myxococcales bacterium]|nr:hypothetical protein [Myxococcales bacterium]